MIRLKDTKFWKNYAKYDKIVEQSSMRSTVDGLIYWKLLNYFQFNKFLEIGIYQGLTTGLFFESNPEATVDAVDPVDNLDLFRAHYPEYLDQLNFIRKPFESTDVVFSGKYDFILVDGNHSYEHAMHDINKVLPLMDQTTVLAIDDYQHPGVSKALSELSAQLTDWVPFLRAEQTEFWHHISQDRGEFLDGLLVDPISKFIFIENILDNKNTICKARTVAALTDQIDLFDQCLQRYN